MIKLMEFLLRKMHEQLCAMPDIDDLIEETFCPLDSPDLFQNWCKLCSDDEFCQFVFNRPARPAFVIVDGVANKDRKV